MSRTPKESTGRRVIRRLSLSRIRRRAITSANDQGCGFARLDRRSGGLPRAVMLAVLVVSLSGCASIPTSGVVATHAPQADHGVPGAVDIQPGPPAQGAPLSDIVDGFLLAMASLQPDHAMAKQYLTPEAAATWDPGSGILIYADGSPPTIQGEDQVTIDAQVVGRVSPDGSFANTDTAEWRWDFGAVRDAAGQWRLSNPPDGLALSQYMFLTSYASMNAYFLDQTGTVLVPDPRYVVRGSWGVAAAVRMVVDGPSSWLAPLVTATPSSVSLAEPASVDDTGVLTVPLQTSGVVLGADEATRLAKECAATARGVRNIASVRVTVGGQVVPLLGETLDHTLPTAILDSYDATPKAPALLYAVSQDRVGIVDERVSGFAHLPGTLGSQLPQASVATVSPDGNHIVARPGPDQVHATGLTVSPDGDRIALTTTDGLVVGSATGDVLHVIDQEGLLRPQFDRTGQVWTMRSDQGRTTVFIVRPCPVETLARCQSMYTASLPEGMTVLAFRISPDGLRMALVTSQGGVTQVGLAQIIRTADGVVDVTGWRPIHLLTEGAPVAAMTDVAWMGPSFLVVLGAVGASGASEALRVDLDGLNVTGLGKPNFGAGATLAAVTTYVRGDEVHLAVLDSLGQVWSYQNTYQWNSLVKGSGGIAYPG